MVAAPILVKAAPDGEVARLLALAEKAPVLVEQNGIRFRIERDENEPEKAYDPEAFREHLRRFAGIFTPEEADAMKEMIYRAREEGARPADRPCRT